MSTSRRAIDIFRGYVNHGLDYVKRLDDLSAEHELERAMGAPVESLEPSDVPAPAPVEITIEEARRLLDVAPQATGTQIESSYAQLAELLDPNRFPLGTPARERAKRLRQRLDKAKSLLMENVDPTVRRFEGLEID